MPVLRIGHTPDADDAFMYYAITRGLVPVGDYTIQHVLEDIERLNQRALGGELEVTAISAAAYPGIAAYYRIMRAGSSIGRRYGPIVVTRADQGATTLVGKRIAVPGVHTTAYLLLRLYLDAFQPVPMPFDAIISAVQEKRVEAGLLIHEGQITYEEHRLERVLDLGEAWGRDTGLPIPLGLDVVRRDLGEERGVLIARALLESIEYAFSHEDDALAYAAPFSRGIDLETCRRFVRMYVNQDTLDMGEEGQQALEVLFRMAKERGIISSVPPIDLL